MLNFLYLEDDGKLYRSEAIFTTAVGHSSKRTLARWHVTTPEVIVERMLDLKKI